MKILPALILVIAVALAWLYYDREGDRFKIPGSGSSPTDLARPIPAPSQAISADRHYLFDVTDHSPEQISAMLMRAEQLNREGTSRQQQINIAMVLHGPDIEIFAKHNYPRFHSIVDTARRLEQQGVIDFKVCQRVMSERGITQMDLPDFLEPVPYAPDEIRRLRHEGYVTL